MQRLCRVDSDARRGPSHCRHTVAQAATATALAAAILVGVFSAGTATATATATAAAAATTDSAPGFVEDRLKELWPKVQAPLLQALEARMTERTRNLQKFLDDRSAREITSITAVMQELERSIRETLNAKDDSQMQFDWTEIEK